MPRYCFNWTITGSSLIEAETLAEAQKIFDEMSVQQCREQADQTDFCQDQVLVETAPNVFDEAESP